MITGIEERTFFCQLFSSEVTAVRCSPSSPLSSASSSLTPATFMSSLTPYIQPLLSSKTTELCKPSQPDPSGFRHLTCSVSWIDSFLVLQFFSFRATLSPHRHHLLHLLLHSWRYISVTQQNWEVARPVRTCSQALISKRTMYDPHHQDLLEFVFFFLNGMKIIGR